MNGQAIGAQPLAFAGLRQLTTEAVGPRPGGVRADRAAAAGAQARLARSPSEPRTKAATRP